MPKLQLISESQQKKFDSYPMLTGKQRERYFVLDEKILEYIDAMKEPDKSSWISSPVRLL